MTPKQRLTAVCNKLILYRSNINTSLVAKGASAVSDIGDVSGAIDTISTGGSDNLPAYAMGTLETINSDSILSVRSSAFWYSNFKYFTAKNCATLASNCFRQNTYLKELHFGSSLQYTGNSMCVGDTALEFADLGGCSNIDGGGFQNCSKFATIILRKSDGICTLSNVNAFSNTPFRNGTGGTVYIPSALKSTYEQASNWSALESVTFANLEGSIYE